MAWSDDGRWLVVGGHGYVLVLGDDGRRLYRLPAGRGRNRVTFWPDGQVAAIGDNENNTYLWNPKTKKTRRVAGIAVCAGYYADAWSCEPGRGRFRVTVLAGARMKYVVKQWGPKGFRPVWTASERNASRPSALLLRNGGNGLIVAGGSTYSRTEVTRHIAHQAGGPPGQRGHGSYFVLSPKLVSGGHVRRYHRGSFSCERTGVGRRILSLGHKRYGSTLLAGHEDGQVSLFAGCDLRWTRPHSKRPVVGVAHHPVQLRGASVDDHGRLCLWDTKAGKRTGCRQLTHP